LQVLNANKHSLFHTERHKLYKVSWSIFVKTRNFPRTCKSITNYLLAALDSSNKTKHKCNTRVGEG